MKNFNTNQTRYFYVATAIDSSLATEGDIALKTLASGEILFGYKNADGIVVSTDTIKTGNIVSVKKTTAAEMATKLMAHTVAIDTNAVALSSLVGKTVTCTITFQEFVDYDASSTLSVVASVTGDSVNTASAQAFHKALAIAIAKALPQPDPSYPLLNVFSNGSLVTKDTAESSVTGASAGVVLVEAVQKYVRGKLSGEPIPFSVSFRLADGNKADIVWGTDTVAPSAISGYTVVPANYVLADLEYFAKGEIGDYYRGGMWPNDFEPTYAINPKSGTAYNVLSVEYFWAGAAEHVQKSPRLIQIAAPATDSNDIVTTLYNAVVNASGNGLGKAKSDIASLDTRVTALENA